MCLSNRRWSYYIGLCLRITGVFLIPLTLSQKTTLKKPAEIPHQNSKLSSFVSFQLELLRNTRHNTLYLWIVCLGVFWPVYLVFYCCLLLLALVWVSVWTHWLKRAMSRLILRLAWVMDCWMKSRLWILISKLTFPLTNIFPLRCFWTVIIY